MDSQEIKSGIIVTANTSTSDQNNIELIQIDVEDDNDPLLGEPVPKTAKDLFSDFKATDESDIEQNDDGSDSDSDLPLVKRSKTNKKKAAKKSVTNEDGTVKKKVCLLEYMLCSRIFITMLQVVFLEI